MTEKVNTKWSEERVQTLLDTVGSSTPVSVASVQKAAEVLGISDRSVSSKLRNLNVDVASMATVKAPAFTPEQGDALASYVNANAGSFTYKEIAESFGGGVFTAKQVQGKLLALELTSSVKPAEKIEVARTYSPVEEETFIKMANAGKFIEEIAVTLGKTVPSVRGKALSLARSAQISAIPAQKESHAKNVVDAIASLGATVATMTVAEIAKAVDKTDRGIKTLLTRRGLNVADYKGADKKAKAEAKAAA